MIMPSPLCSWSSPRSLLTMQPHVQWLIYRIYTYVHTWARKCGWVWWEDTGPRKRDGGWRMCGRRDTKTCALIHSTFLPFTSLCVISFHLRELAWVTLCAEQWRRIHHEKLCEEDAVLRASARAYVDRIRLLPRGATHTTKQKTGYGSVCSQCRYRRGNEEVQKQNEVVRRPARGSWRDCSQMPRGCGASQTWSLNQQESLIKNVFKKKKYDSYQTLLWIEVTI